jgi:ADP-ribose pyrophosphatase YjhB (NUDIX family)
MRAPGSGTLAIILMSMRGPQIKVKAFAVLLNQARDAHLVQRASDARKAPTDFHRLLGGHVEFGEAAMDAIRREILEETAAELLDPQCLGVLENRFVYEDQPGHEIVFVYSGSLSPPEPVADGGGWLSDNGDAIWVEWRPLASDGTTIPLYPDGVEKLIDTLVDNVRG